MSSGAWGKAGLRSVHGCVTPGGGHAQSWTRTALCVVHEGTLTRQPLTCQGRAGGFRTADSWVDFAANATNIILRQVLAIKVERQRRRKYRLIECRTLHSEHDRK